MKVSQNLLSVLALISVNTVLAAPVPVEDVALIIARAAEPEPVAADYGSYVSSKSSQAYHRYPTLYMYPIPKSIAP